MTLFWFDWAYLFLIAAVTPVWSWYDHRQKKATEIPIDLIREYRSTLIFHLGLAGLVVAVWLTAGRPWDQLGFRTAAWTGQSWIGLLIALVALAPPLANLAGALFAPGQDAARLKAYGDLKRFLPKVATQHRWGMAVSVSAGFAEEIAYRGFVFFLLAQFMPLWTVLVAQAVIFGLAHLYQGWGGALMAALSGALLGGIYWATGSLWPPILVHVAADAAILTTAYVLYRRNPEAQTDSLDVER